MANEFYHVRGAQDVGEGFSSEAYSINYIKALYDKMGAIKHLRNHSADVAAFGAAVTMPNMPRVTPVDINPTTGAFTYNNTTVPPASIVIDQWKAIPYQVLDNVFYQSKVDVRMALAANAADSMQDDLDHSLVKLIPSLSGTNSAGSLGSDLTEASVNLAIQKLVDNHVPLGNPDDFVWVLPSSQYAAVHGIKNGYAANYRIIPGDETNGGKDIQAKIDTLMGFELFFRADSEMTVTGGKIGGLFYRDSVGFAIQKNPSQRPPVYIPGTANLEIVTMALYGRAILKDLTACKILCK